MHCPAAVAISTRDDERMENDRYIVCWEEAFNDCQTIGTCWAKRTSEILDGEQLSKYIITHYRKIQNVMVYKLTPMPEIKFTEKKR